MDRGTSAGMLERYFEENRPHLRLLAYRILGTLTDADDALQEAWIRASRSDISTIENFKGWLSTITSRASIDLLRARTARREEFVGLSTEGAHKTPATVHPEREALLAETIGSALMIVLDQLSPAERISVVLHDIFDFAFGEIAVLVGRSEVAVRQLASRGRRRIRGASAHAGADTSRERELVRAFLAAAREGDFQSLLELLSPDVVFRADDAGTRLGAVPRARGSMAIARSIFRHIRPAVNALIDGRPGVLLMGEGGPIGVVTLWVTNGKITEIDLVAEPEDVRRFDLVTFAR